MCGPRPKMEEGKTASENDTLRAFVFGTAHHTSLGRSNHAEHDEE
jgi:hypothetical protein